MVQETARTIADLKVKDVDLMRASMALLMVQQGLETVNRGLAELRAELKPNGLFVSTSDVTYDVNGAIIGKTGLDLGTVGIEVLSKSPTFKELWESRKIKYVKGVELGQTVNFQDKDGTAVPDCPLLPPYLPAKDFVANLSRVDRREFNKEMKKVSAMIKTYLKKPRTKKQISKIMKTVAGKKAKEYDIEIPPEVEKILADLRKKNKQGKEIKSSIVNNKVCRK